MMDNLSGYVKKREEYRVNPSSKNKAAMVKAKKAMLGKNVQGRAKTSGKTKAKKN